MKIILTESQLNLVKESILNEFNKTHFRGQNILYHTTFNNNLLAILSSGVLEPYLYRTANLFTKNQRVNTISFSRDKNFTMGKTDSHTLMFDGDLIKRDYKLIPYNDFPNTKKSDPSPSASYDKEYEEAIITNKPFPIEKYLIGIRANNFIQDSKDDINRERFISVYQYCKEKGIPYFSAFGRSDMISQNLIHEQILNKLAIDNILCEQFRIFENMQLADKLYFNNGKLNDEDKQLILNVSKRDYTTKLLCDLYLQMKEQSFIGHSEIIKKLNDIHNQLLSYNKNVFPIANFDINNSQNNLDYLLFDSRSKILKDIKQLPSIAIRNLKNEIRLPRDYYGFKKYADDLEYFLSQFSLLSNRNPELRNNIYKKMFKSDITIDTLIRFADEKENLLGGAEFTKDSILKLVNDTYDMQIIYNSNKAMVIDVESPEAIKSIGCNSLWCFTYGSGFDSAYRQWNNYSYNDHVYVIIDFNEPSDSPNFMHVLIKPLEKSYDEDNEDSIPLYNMANEQTYNPYGVLNSIFGKINYNKLFKFE